MEQSAQINYLVSPETIDKIDRSLDLMESISRENTYGRYLTTGQVAKYIKKSEGYIIRRVAKEVPSLPGSPLVFDIRDIDEWTNQNKRLKDKSGSHVG